MKIWTSYYANMKNIPADFFLVSTSGAISDDIKKNVDSWNQSLAPSKSIYFEYKNTQDWKQYVKRFKEERLTFDWMDKLVQWEEKSKSLNKTLDNIVLLCYEKPTEFCHRHILAESIEKEFNIIVEEYGFKNYERVDYKMELKKSADFLF